MDHLNWGVLGASKFALEHLTPAMQLSKNNRFLALATRSKQKAAPFVRLEPGIDVFDDYDQLLADNRINEDSTWDMELLNLEIAGLSELNFDLDLLGFDSSELDKFFPFIQM